MGNLIQNCPMPDCGSTLIGIGTAPCGVATVNCGHCGMSVPGKTKDVTGAIERWNNLAARAVEISQKTDCRIECANTVDPYMSLDGGLLIETDALILDRVASDAATTKKSVDCCAERFLRSIFQRPDLSSDDREAFIKEMIGGREDMVLCFDDFKTIASLLLADADVISRASRIMQLIDDYVDAELFNRPKARQARTKIRYALTSELEKTLR